VAADRKRTPCASGSWAVPGSALGTGPSAAFPADGASALASPAALGFPQLQSCLLPDPGQP